MSEWIGDGWLETGRKDRWVSGQNFQFRSHLEISSFFDSHTSKDAILQHDSHFNTLHFSRAQAQGKIQAPKTRGHYTSHHPSSSSPKAAADEVPGVLSVISENTCRFLVCLLQVQGPQEGSELEQMAKGARHSGRVGGRGSLDKPHIWFRL